MIITYLKTAWRGILRNKVYSALNIAGLAIGMAVALLIGLWIYYQCNFDRFTPGYAQAYQVKYNFSENGVVSTAPEVALPLADALKNDVPEIQHVAIAYGPDNYGSQSDIYRVGDKSIAPVELIAGDDFLNIVQLPLLEGSADNALSDPNNIVLTASVARALFGNADPMGKTLQAYNNVNFKVTAVLKDLPTNSTLQFGAIMPWRFYVAGWPKAYITNWDNNLFKLYASLKPNAEYARVAPKIKGLVEKYAPRTYAMMKQQVIMQPMADWHLYNVYKNGVAGGLIDYIWMFGVIGILVLLIACINFTNLSTARSEKRAREVGIRKVIGSSRKALVAQFLMESVILAFLSFVLSLILVQWVLPSFNALAGTHIGIPYTNGWFWLIMLSYILITGLLAGSRPAFYLSSFQPVKVLKRTLSVGTSAIQSRKVLVVLQFTCSIALISGTIVVYQQIQYGLNRPRGYDPNRLLVTEGSNNIPFQALKHEVLATGVVTGITQSLSPMTDVYSHNTIDAWPGKMPNEAFTPAMNAVGDTDYFKTVGMQLLAGRNFTGNPGDDSASVILNESAARRMRLTQPLNQYISWQLSWVPRNLRVIGVVKDILSNAPFAPAEPVIYVWQPDWSFTTMYRLSPNVSTRVALERLGPIFNKYHKDFPFQYYFSDDKYAEKFAVEKLLGRLSGVFAVLAIFISCLGLFGLIACVAEQRTREIGIRKVLGASISQVLVLITKDFIVLVGISCVIASALGFFFLQHWLDGYYYRIHLGVGVFLGAAAGAIVIAIVTVSFQALKAALMNPVKSLRSE